MGLSGERLVAGPEGGKAFFSVVSIVFSSSVCLLSGNAFRVKNFYRATGSLWETTQRVGRNFFSAVCRGRAGL